MNMGRRAKKPPKLSVESAGSTITGQLWKALTADDRRIISDDYPELADALNEAAGLSE